jgi:transposase
MESVGAHAGESIVERVAGIDVGKAEVVCCVRVPDAARRGRRGQEVRAFSTMTVALHQMCDWFAELGVQRVVMESTSDYWKPPFYVLEARGFDPWLVNAREVKHLPGRPKSDRLDAVWLAKLAERQMLRPSFVLPPDLRELRELTRYRVDLVVMRNSEKQRAEKLLEDAQIKVSVVASDLFGVSGRAMMAALIGGERDPETLADLARGVLRKKTPDLIEALTGRFNDQHAWRLAKILQRVDDTDRDIAEVDAQIERQLAPFADAVTALDQIPGIDRVAAAAVIGEIGIDMARFPTAGHLCSWAGFAPLTRASAGREKKRKTGHGSRYLARAMGNAAAGAARTQTHLGQRQRELAARRGKDVANVATGRAILVAVWHLLHEPAADFHDLGPQWRQSKRSPHAQARRHVRRLEALGFNVTITPAA